MSSSSKVKCTCGWSWNKSDSSKKDMYVCHECGRDNSNNMKNGGWLDQYQEGGNLSEPPKSQYKRLYGHAKDYSQGENEKMRIDPNTGYGYFPPELSTVQQKEVPNSPWNVSRFLFDPFIKNQSQGVHNAKYDKEGKMIDTPIEENYFSLGLNRRERYDAAKNDITNYYKEDLKLNDDEVEEKVDDAMDLIRKMRRTEEMMQRHNSTYKDFQNYDPQEVFKSAVGFDELFPQKSIMGDIEINPRQAKRAYKMFQKTWRGTSGKEARQNAREELKKAKEAFKLAKEQKEQRSNKSNSSYKADPNFDPEAQFYFDNYGTTLNSAKLYDPEKSSTSTADEKSIVKPTQYYNTDPKRGKVETPGNKKGVRYIPISNSAQLKKWKEQEGKLENGGWLDSYADGGSMQEHQENYNNNSVSLPEGYVGEGYDTSGRNYSPAWGGQFQDGGEIPIAQNGNKKPLYVESKNDPRYKAYQDSLKVYNYGNKLKKILKDSDSPGEFKEAIAKLGTKDIYDNINNIGKNEVGKAFNDLKKLNNKPVLNTGEYSKEFSLFGLNVATGRVPLYKKPQQQVMVKPTTTKPSTKSKPSTKPQQKEVNVKPQLQPRVEAINLPPMQNQDPSFPKQELDLIRPIQAPKSYNVNMQRYNMQGPSDYYQANEEGVDYERAMQIKAASDAYNKSIEEKYGNPEALKNPKAVERLKQLRQDVQLTPVFQNGGTKEKVLKTADKVVEASVIGKMLDFIPGAEIIYDVNNILEGLNEGDYKKIGANTVGALLPGVSGKVFEAVAEDWLPPTPEIEKKKMQFNLNSSPADRQKYLKKYGPGYLNNPQFIKDQKLQMGGSVYPVNYVPQAQNGKLTFLQPTSDKLPKGYRIPYADPSSELAMSIGGEDGEPSYLIPSFKYGKPLYSPIEEFKKTGEHLGGPFKTWQEADEWERTVRHPYVEQGKDIPLPIKTWGEMAMGGSIPGAVGFSYARTNNPAPSNGPYAKKTMASAKSGKVIKDDRGQWAHPGEITEIDQSKKGSYIDMGPDPKTGKPITQNILAVSDTGDVKLMMPGGKYKLSGTKVTEYPIAQEGVEITVDEGEGKKRKILTDSSEYAKLYDEGRIGVQNDDESISFNPFNEVVVTPYDNQYPFYQELSDEEKKYFNSDSPIGRQIRSKAQDNVGFNADKATDFAMGWLRDLPLASLQAPQSALVEGVEALRGNDFNMLNALDPSTQRIPSETWGVENPYAAFAVDAITDPETLLGMSILKNPLQKGMQQALVKTSQFAAPRLDKARTLAKDMSAVISGEQKTIQPKIDAINSAEYAFHQSKEYSDFLNENLALRQKKYAIENKLSNIKNRASLSEINQMTDKIDKLNKRINVAEQFKVNDDGLVQSGKDTSLGLRTGSTDIMDLSTGEKFPISTSVPGERIIHTLEGDKVIKTIDNATLPQASPEYSATVKKNIDFIETQIPGAKVFGSAKNVAEAEVPHIVGDYDVLMSQTQYDKFAKANPSVGNNGFAELHNIPGAAKGVEPIDINVIQEKGGKAIGTRAIELFKQVSPDEYYAAAKKAIKSKSEIKIPYSSQELVDMTNPTTKSVVDAYESIKDKHINKIDALINYGKPSVVAEGQQQFVKSLVGSKGSIGHQFPLEQLSNVETNKEILNKIDFIGNKSLVAADAERMQLAINDYYMNNSILARQVDPGKINKIEAAIKEYYPGAKGGAVNGIGQNHVMLGHPFHGDGNIISMKQLGMDLDTSDPMSYINSIEHQTSGEKLFSEEERTILSNILADIKMDDRFKYTANQSENTSQLIENLPYSDEGKKALYEFGKRTNRTIVKKDSRYGNSTYASTLRDFDEAIDAMQYQLSDSKNALKSFRQRADAAAYATSAQPTISPDLELLPKQFNAIKGYVEGGIDRAKLRLDELSKQRRKISEDIEALSDKAYNKKYKEEIEKLNQSREKINKESDQIAQMRRDLFDRKVHLNKLEENMKTVGILGGGTATVIGLGIYGYKENERINEEFNKELNIRKKYYPKDKQTNSGVDAIMDAIPNIKRNGGNITKAKNGLRQEQKGLVNLDQLTNFTNYNTKQPGGWLDKY
jgi:hypothetical protein